MDKHKISKIVKVILGTESIGLSSNPLKLNISEEYSGKSSAEIVSVKSPNVVLLSRSSNLIKSPLVNLLTLLYPEIDVPSVVNSTAETFDANVFLTEQNVLSTLFLTDDVIQGSGTFVGSSKGNNAQVIVKKDDVHVIKFCVSAGSGLKKKDKSGGCNSYVSVYFNGTFFVNEVISNDVNPAWNFKMLLPIDFSKNVTIGISLWNRSSDYKTDDAFLGVTSVSLNEARSKIKIQGGKYEVWKELEKRGPRSNISGKIRVSLESFPRDVDLATSEDLFQCFSSDPKTDYTDILKRCINMGSGKLNADCRNLLSIIATAWNLNDNFKLFIYLDQLVAFYSSKGCSSKLILDILESSLEIAKSEKVSNADRFLFERTFQYLFTQIYQSLSSFFTHLKNFTDPQNELKSILLIIESLNIFKNGITNNGAGLRSFK
ncbi:Protein unc-13 C, partial [Nowakowskiella sp. JEL0078]